MFEDLIKKLQNMNNQQISIPIEADEKGYVDKECPSKQCEFLFKVNQEDWKNLFKDEKVWCPMCRYEAPADQWFTKKQIEHGKSEAFTVVKGEIDRALRTGAQKFNRKQSRNAFITMSMEVKGGTQRTYTLPAKAADVMQLEIECEDCSAHFSVIGSAYFCPACGANSVVRTYNDSLRKIKAKIDSVETVRKVLSDAVGIDEAELTCRSLVETCLSDGVTAFQKYCEGLYELTGKGKAPFNVFQRIDDGSELWHEVVSQGYDSWLTIDELRSLKLLYQKRHILVHNEGIVDQKYIDKSGDSSYKIGQRIVVSKRDIEALLFSLEKLGNGLSDACNRG